VKKIINALAGAAISAAALSAGLWGAGIASAAPDVVGDTYDDATKAIEDDGGTAVVATRVGDTLDQGDCIVTTVSNASFLRIDTSDDNEVLVSLNCAGSYATATTPGPSLGSPVGRAAKAKADEEAAKEEEESLEETSTPGV
jgi:hypothetical protein